MQGNGDAFFKINLLYTNFLCIFFNSMGILNYFFQRFKKTANSQLGKGVYSLEADTLAKTLVISKEPVDLWIYISLYEICLIMN